MTRKPSIDEIPVIIKEVGFDFDWVVEKVWKLDLPVTQMDIDHLVWHFAIPFYWHDNGVYNLAPKKIIEQPEIYSEEYQRTLKADLQYPIDIMENKGRWVILDGLHRLMKAHIKGMKQVKVRIVPREKIPEIIQNENTEGRKS